MPPLRPSAALAEAYNAKLQALIKEMGASLAWWIKAAYRAHPPAIAQDADNIHAAQRMQREFEELGAKWLDRFEQAAPRIAAYFAVRAKDRVDSVLAKHLRDAGISVRFQPTLAQKEVFAATLHDNVALIKNIAEQHIAQVQGSVYRSVMTGRDIGGLAKDLEHRLGITQRRAAFIARTQNSMATSAMHRVRQQELGITKAKWCHSHGGREPRPDHLRFDGHEYDIAKGALLDDGWVWPGQLPNCRCSSASIIPALQVS